MHRVVLYVKDLNEENTHEGLRNTFRNNKYPEFVTVGDIRTVDIGEFEDDHPLNKIGSDHESYFKVLDSTPTTEATVAEVPTEKSSGGFAFRSDVKSCAKCKDKKPLNSWNYCEYCSGKNIRLVFYEGKLWEQDVYGRNPHDYASYRSEILNFSPEQVQAFLIQELKFTSEGYMDLANRIAKFNDARRDLTIPHRWRE
jgi:hypothetical protein